MNRKVNPPSNPGKAGMGMFARLALVVACVVVIVACMSVNKGSKYVYDVGRPWMYNTIIASFDFSIDRTEEAIRADEEGIRRKFEPYYNIDASVGERQVARFLEDYADGIPGVGTAPLPAIARVMERLYARGIMEAEDYSEVARDSASRIRVVDGKKASSTLVSGIHSTGSAYRELMGDSTLRAFRQPLQDCDLDNYILANLTDDVKRNDLELNDLLHNIARSSGMVYSGQKIIDRGEMVNDSTYLQLQSFERASKRKSETVSTIPSTIAGRALYVAVLMFLLSTYLSVFRRQYFGRPRWILMLYTMVTVFPVGVSLMMTYTILNVYVLPFAMVPMFIGVFMDSRTAFISHVIMVLICAAVVNYQYEFIIVQLVAGLVAIYSLRDLSQRAQLFAIALAVALASAVIYFALQLMQDNVFSDLDYKMYRWFAVNAVLLLFVYPLMLIVEQAFGFVSPVTLIELSNTSKKLLRKLSEEAPGTFQHSVMAGNLGAEVANRIGANAQLVRTGAMYHDIGKMKAPYCYTENQQGVNPLDDMDRMEAAQIIINHVAEGLRLAERNNLPGVIRDFIKTHHGAGKTKFFYITYRNEHPGEPVDESSFTYPGPNPFTKEQAILMMADSVEAASRSLKEYTEESISSLVGNIIDGQVKDGFFADCPITFRDIAQAKVVLIERLKTIYHTRVSYPELKKPAQKREAPKKRVFR